MLYLCKNMLNMQANVKICKNMQKMQKYYAKIKKFYTSLYVLRSTLLSFKFMQIYDLCIYAIIPSLIIRYIGNLKKFYSNLKILT